VAGGFVDELYRNMYPAWNYGSDTSAFATDVDQMGVVLKMMAAFFDSERDIDVFFTDRRVVEMYLWFAVQFAEYAVCLLDNGILRMCIPDATGKLRTMKLNFIDVSFFMKWENCHELRDHQLLMATLNTFHLPCCQVGLLTINGQLDLVRTEAYFLSQKSRTEPNQFIAIGKLTDSLREEAAAFRHAVEKYRGRGYKFVECDGLQLYAEGNGATYPAALDVFFAMPHPRDSFWSMFQHDMDKDEYISTGENEERAKKAATREDVDVERLRKIKRARTEELPWPEMPEPPGAGPLECEL
jgi:hypothetical protein